MYFFAQTCRSTAARETVAHRFQCSSAVDWSGHIRRRVDSCSPLTCHYRRLNSYQQRHQESSAIPSPTAGCQPPAPRRPAGASPPPRDIRRMRLNSPLHPPTDMCSSLALAVSGSSVAVDGTPSAHTSVGPTKYNKVCRRPVTQSAGRSGLLGAQNT